jgi:hypothetical protein
MLTIKIPCPFVILMGDEQKIITQLIKARGKPLCPNVKNEKNFNVPS